MIRRQKRAIRDAERRERLVALTLAAFSNSATKHSATVISWDDDVATIEIKVEEYGLPRSVLISFDGLRYFSGVSDHDLTECIAELLDVGVLEFGISLGGLSERSSQQAGE